MAAEAAVGAVAAGGSLAGRVGDFGRGFVNVDLGEAGFDNLVLDDGGCFAATAGGGLEAADCCADVFFGSFSSSFFGSFAFPGFGDALLANGCLVDAFALVGVRGSVGVFLSGLPFPASFSVGGPDLLADAVSIAAGCVAGFDLFSRFRVLSESLELAGNFASVWLAEPTSLALGSTAGFLAGAPLGLPFASPLVVEGLDCEVGGWDCAVAALALEVFDGLAFFPLSCSNGDPLSIEPSSALSLARAAPPDTAASSFGSAGSIPAVFSSAAETGLSGFASDVPSMLVGFVIVEGSAFLGSD